MSQFTWVQILQYLLLQDTIRQSPKRRYTPQVAVLSALLDLQSEKSPCRKCKGVSAWTSLGPRQRYPWAFGDGRDSQDREKRFPQYVAAFGRVQGTSRVASVNDQVVKWQTSITAAPTALSHCPPKRDELSILVRQRLLRWHLEFHVRSRIYAR